MEEEKKKGRLQQDFETAIRNAEALGAFLIKKYPWMKEFRFKGDISFKSNRRKSIMMKKEEEGEEISFGLNMVLSYEDSKKKMQTTDVVIKFKPVRFHSINFKAIVPNPTTEDLVKQWEKTWIILFSGGSVTKPKSVVVTKVGEFPVQCFKDSSGPGQRGRFTIAFGKWITWTKIDIIDLFQRNQSDMLFEKLRRGHWL